MGTLAEQLMQKGLLDPKVVKIKDQQERSRIGQQHHDITKKSGKEASLPSLETSTSVSVFKDIAKRLLLEQPDLAPTILKQAHRFQQESGGKKLIWLMFQIRDMLPKISEANREKFLNKALRKANPIVEFIA